MDDSHSTGGGESQDEVMGVGGRRAASRSRVCRASNKSLVWFLGMVLIPDPVTGGVGRQWGRIEPRFQRYRLWRLQG